MKASNRLHIFTITIILLFVSGCSNHKIRHELRAFQRSEVSLSFELERVLDRNIGIESPGSGAVSMGILSILTGVYGEGKRNYEYSVEFFFALTFFYPPCFLYLQNKGQHRAVQ